MLHKLQILIFIELNLIATTGPNYFGDYGGCQWDIACPLAHNYVLPLNILRSFKIFIYLILEHIIYTSSINTFPWQSIPLIYHSLRSAYWVKCEAVLDLLTCELFAQEESKAETRSLPASLSKENVQSAEGRVSGSVPTLVGEVLLVQRMTCLCL